MILLNDIVEIPTTADHDGLPIRVLLPQLAQCPMTRRVAVEI
jgi:hypothetical protein